MPAMTAMGVARSRNSSGMRPRSLSGPRIMPLSAKMIFQLMRPQQEAGEERRDDEEQQQALVAAAPERDEVGEREAEQEAQQRGEAAERDRADELVPVLRDLLGVDGEVPGHAGSRCPASRSGARPGTSGPWARRRTRPGTAGRAPAAARPRTPGCRRDQALTVGRSGAAGAAMGSEARRPRRTAPSQAAAVSRSRFTNSYSRLAISASGKISVLVARAGSMAIIASSAPLTGDTYCTDAASSAAFAGV